VFAWIPAHVHGFPCIHVGSREQGHWALPSVSKAEAQHFLKTVKLPTLWGSEHRRALRKSDSKPDQVPALKAHTNLVFVQSGLLTLIAMWMRPLSAQGNRRIVDFTVALQQVTRTITRLPLQEEVSDICII
jgi:hypothetical protein